MHQREHCSVDNDPSLPDAKRLASVQQVLKIAIMITLCLFRAGSYTTYQDVICNTKARTHVVVIWIRDFGVKRVTRDQLLSGIVKAAGVPLTMAHVEDSKRINAKSNTVSVLTNDQERSLRYAEVRSFHFQDKRVDVYSHGTTPDRFRRIVVPKLLNPETEVDEGELLEHLVKSNPHTVIMDAKRMGRTPSVLITWGTHKPPGFIKFLCGLFRFHDYLEKKQACMRCWKMGHRMDTCPAPDTGRCPNCEEIYDHPPKLLASTAVCPRSVSTLVLQIINPR
ncbi:hypothetical protein ISCGN_009201 [Ixodes scapularis]